MSPSRIVKGAGTLVMSKFVATKTEGCTNPGRFVENATTEFERTIAKVSRCNSHILLACRSDGAALRFFIIMVDNFNDIEYLVTVGVRFQMLYHNGME